MPVWFDSTAKGTLLVGPGDTADDITVSHNVSPIARDRVFAYVAVVWNGNADTSTATFSATFGGVAMTEVGAVTWDTNKGCVRLFELEDAPRGAQSVVASFSGMPTEFLTSRRFMVVSLTYSGVEESGTPVDEGGVSGTASTVAVDSDRAAHRVLSVHGVGNPRQFTKTGYNQTKRQQVAMLAGGSLLVGDAAGDTLVTLTATHTAATANWGAIGVAMTPSIVEISSSRLAGAASMRCAVAIFRVVEPHPDRLWVIPALDEVDTTVLGSFQYSADGIRMPIWPKDAQSKLDYTLDWSKHLADDDKIIDARFVSGGALQMFSPTYNDSQAQCWLAGGVTGVSYPVTCSVTTQRGRQHDRTFRIAVGQQ